MDTVRTIACKLAPTPSNALRLDATLVAFADACNFIADVARREHTTNKVKLQHACYTDCGHSLGCRPIWRSAPLPVSVRP